MESRLVSAQYRMKPAPAFSVRWRCPAPMCRGRCHASLTGTSAAQGVCDVCREKAIVAEREDGAIDGERIISCPICACREFFIRKDFPQRLGLALVILFGLTASVFYYFERIEACFATLAGLVIIDAIIYLFVGRVTVCYRCRAEYRGLPYNASHEGFDLATSEKYGHRPASRGSVESSKP